MSSAGPANWVRLNPKNGGADLGSTKVGPISAQQIFFLFFSLGRTQPNHLGWAITGPA